jgi:hypothetical protein
MARSTPDAICGAIVDGSRSAKPTSRAIKPSDAVRTSVKSSVRKLA